MLSKQMKCRNDQKVHCSSVCHGLSHLCSLFNWLKYSPFFPGNMGSTSSASPSPGYPTHAGSISIPRKFNSAQFDDQQVCCSCSTDNSCGTLMDFLVSSPHPSTSLCPTSSAHNHESSPMSSRNDTRPQS